MTPLRPGIEKRLERLRQRWSDWLSEVIGSPVLVAVVFAAIYAWILFPVAHFYWFVPAGWRFAALALLPWRYWPWILGGEFVARVICVVIPWHKPALLAAFSSAMADPATLVLIFAGPLASLPGSVLLRLRSQHAHVNIEIDSPRAMGWLLVACLISACGETLANLLYIHIDGHIDVATQIGMGYPPFALGKLVGDYIGVIALAPVLLALNSAKTRVAESFTLPNFALLLAFAAAYVAVMRSPLDTAVYDYTRILVLVPAFVIAFRHGWRNAAIALTICSFLVALVPALQASEPSRNLFTQLLLAISGSAALLLGSAIDAQRRSSATLAAQNAQLENANVDLDRLGVELREAAQRNLRLEEEQRRRFAAEIHDELGQNLTAVHTRVKLAAERLDAAQLGDVTTAVYDILATMRRSIHGLMDSLRPSVLDEFGLARALGEGPLRDLAEHAGIRYEFSLLGEAALVVGLDDDTQLAVWRIAQEGVSNVVRHADADSLRVRLRIGVRNSYVLIILDLRDDGIGTAAARRSAIGGHGIQGIRDRAIAFTGTMHLASNARGTRLHVLLRQPV